METRIRTVVVLLVMLAFTGYPVAGAVAQLQWHMDDSLLRQNDKPTSPTETKKAKKQISEAPVLNDQDELVKAAATGDLARVRDLVGQNVPINERGRDHRLALLAAIQAKQKDIVLFLLKNGADVNITEWTTGTTPLIAATTQGWDDVAKSLIAKGASVSAQTIYGTSALSVAAAKGDIELARYFIRLDVDMDACGYVALLAAAKAGNKAMVELLLDHGAARAPEEAARKRDIADPRSLAVGVVPSGPDFGAYTKKVRERSAGTGTGIGGGTSAGPAPKRTVQVRTFAVSPLRVALTYGYEEIAIAMIRKGMKIGEGWQSTDDRAAEAALVVSLQEGLFKAAKAIIDHGADVNGKTNGYPLISYFMAFPVAKVPPHDIVRFLCERRADLEQHPTKDGRTPLMIAAENGRTDIAALLLSRGAKVNAQAVDPPGSGSIYRGATALTLAAAGGHKEVVDLLLANKADCLARTAIGRTALILAIERAHSEIAKILIAKSDVNAATPDGQTPLKAALSNKNYEIAELLLQQGANINAEQMQGVLSTAVTQNDIVMVRFLAKHGKDMAELNEGLTPLQYAAQRGLNEMVNELLAVKADIDGRDRWGRTPLMQAAQMGHQATVEHLIAKGADIHAVDAAGLNAYALASMGRHADVARYLASKGCDTMDYIKRDEQGMMVRDECEVQLEDNLRACRTFLKDGQIRKDGRANAERDLILISRMCEHRLIQARLTPKERDLVHDLARQAAEVKKSLSKKDLYETDRMIAYLLSSCAPPRKEKVYTRLELDELGVLFAGIWKEVASALAANDIEKAVSYYLPPVQERWAAVFKGMPEAELQRFANDMLKNQIYVDRVEENSRAVCQLLATRKGQKYSFQLILIAGPEGEWLIYSY